MGTDNQKIFRITLLMFFLSGLSSLIYEVIWFKRFTHIWGSSSLAQESVVACFLFGLALGAYLFGRISSRAIKPLLLYAILELIIAVFAFLIPFEMTLLRRVSAQVYSILHDVPLLHFVFRFLCTFLVIGPPCICMGGTLPLLSRFLFFHQTGNSKVIGILYAINTIGAAFGSYVAGFHLLPSFGIVVTNWVSILINADIALIAFLLSRRLPAVALAADETETAPALPEGVHLTTSRYLVYTAFFLVGCASLILQIVWTRHLAVILGSTTYAFSAMLCTFLLGIGLGSLIYYRIGNRLRDYNFVLSILLIILTTSILLEYIMVPTLSMGTGTIRYLRSNIYLNAFFCILISSVSQLIPTMCMGFLFPLLVDFLRWQPRDIGLCVGKAYTWNTAGSILGVSFAASLLVAVYGTRFASTLSILLYGVAFLCVYSYHNRRSIAGIVFTVLCIVLFNILLNKPYNPLFSNLGAYMYGYTPRETILRNYELRYFREGVISDVLLARASGQLQLHINGKVDATDEGDMDTQLGLAYYPRLFHPDAEEVFVIGYGSGTTAGASLLFPGTFVTCSEIEPYVIEAGRFFRNVNYSPERSPRYKLVLDDGRSYLEGSGNRYDLIISEPSNPWMAGISNLFTVEFYRQVAAHLQPDGIFTQWLQAYSISIEDYTLILRTLQEVFSDVVLVRITEGDTLVLAANRSIIPTDEVLDQAQALVNSIPDVQDDLQFLHQTIDVKTILLKSIFFSTPELERLVKENSTSKTYLSTDNNLHLEFSTPLSLFLPQEMQLDVNFWLLRNADPNLWIRLFQQWECGLPQLSALKEWMEDALGIHAAPVMQPLVDFTTQIAPDDPQILLMALLHETWEGTQFTPLLHKLVEVSPDMAFQAGVESYRQKKFQQAALIFNQLIIKQPTWVTAWAYLGLAYRESNNPALAENCIREVRKLDPFHPFLKVYDEQMVAEG